VAARNLRDPGVQIFRRVFGQRPKTKAQRRGFEGTPDGCYNLGCSTRSQRLTACLCRSPRGYSRVSHDAHSVGDQAVNPRRGQVAQVVERSPEKAGVGGSTPSLATIFSIACRHFINFHINQLTAFLVVRWARSVQNSSGNDFVINEFRECGPCERSLWRAALEWP
jgi:hypothetical protein